ncbi:MAG: M17 family peptidase N-terminal domain-containing protein [Myxococcota bacterium]
MELRFVAPELRRLDGLRCEAAALPYFVEERPFRGALGLLDWRLRGRLAGLRAQGRLTGAEDECLLLPARRRTAFDKLFLFGLGRRDAFDESAAETAAARMLDTLEAARVRAFALTLPGRSVAALAPEQAVGAFLRAANGRTELDEAVLLEGPDAQRVMESVLARARRRARARSLA